MHIFPAVVSVQLLVNTFNNNFYFLIQQSIVEQSIQFHKNLDRCLDVLDQNSLVCVDNFDLFVNIDFFFLVLPIENHRRQLERIKST